MLYGQRGFGGNGLQEGKAVHAWHHEIQQDDETLWVCAQPFERGPPIRDREDSIPLLSQQGGQQFSDRLIVLHYEDRWSSHLPSPPGGHAMLVSAFMESCEHCNMVRGPLGPPPLRFIARRREKGHQSIAEIIGAASSSSGRICSQM
jgi:hypothetical protein